MCGNPPIIEFTEQVWNHSSAPGDTVFYYCKEGFQYRGGQNISMCSVNGQWTHPSISCQGNWHMVHHKTCSSHLIQVFATVPPHLLWIVTGSSVCVCLYCPEINLSVCHPYVSVCCLLCVWFPHTEILCGDPPTLPHTGQLWNGISTPGSTVAYFCKTGYYHSHGNNISFCATNGHWTEADISCSGNDSLWLLETFHNCFNVINNTVSIFVEVDCGAPPLIPHSHMLWDNISTVGSRVVYQCNSGYHNVGEGNVSVCTADGRWDEASLRCQGDFYAMRAPKVQVNDAVCLNVGNKSLFANVIEHCRCSDFCVSSWVVGHI